MSKSKKNTIDPEKMINEYGADAVRWFILSDSPPEKDVQWSDSGVSSANKFLQKVWNLNYLITTRKEKKINNKIQKEFNSKINEFVNKIDNAIKNFRFNVAIALFYEIYKLIRDQLNTEVSNQSLKINLTNIMKLMIPFTPHLAYECLELLNCKTYDTWPIIDKKNLLNQVKIAIQVNGKTRDIVAIKKDLMENEINEIVLKNSKVKKYIDRKKIIRTIFIKNRILNYIINKQ